MEKSLEEIIGLVRQFGMVFGGLLLLMGALWFANEGGHFQGRKVDDFFYWVTAIPLAGVLALVGHFQQKKKKSYGLSDEQLAELTILVHDVRSGTRGASPRSVAAEIVSHRAAEQRDQTQ
ncbi:MAG: hypothetical protein GY822_06365 [Deltaproteobacteria bacterium]|nr:hypothetical protein [Deltaproteobacteria bacterium]